MTAFAGRPVTTPGARRARSHPEEAQRNDDSGNAIGPVRCTRAAAPEGRRLTPRPATFSANRPPGAPAGPTLRLQAPRPDERGRRTGISDTLAAAGPAPARPGRLRKASLLVAERACSAASGTPRACARHRQQYSARDSPGRGGPSSPAHADVKACRPHAVHAGRKRPSCAQGGRAASLPCRPRPCPRARAGLFCKTAARPPLGRRAPTAGPPGQAARVIAQRGRQT